MTATTIDLTAVPPELRGRLADALELVALVEDSYPSARFTDEVRLQYAKDIVHLDEGEAKAAVAVLKRTPRQFAPTAGEVCREVARLQLDAPDWGEVKRLLVKRWEAVIAHRDAPDEWTCPYDRCDGSGFVDVAERPNTQTDCECRTEKIAARRAVAALHPLVREFVEAGYVTWGEIDTVGQGGDTTLESQMRVKWEAFARRAIETRAIAAIEGPPSLRRLESARGEDDRSSRRELGKPDYLAALPRAV